MEELLEVARELRGLEEERRRLVEEFGRFMREVWALLTRAEDRYLSAGDERVEVLTPSGYTFEFSLGRESFCLIRSGGGLRTARPGDLVGGEVAALSEVVEQLPAVLKKKAEELKEKRRKVSRALDMLARAMSDERIRSELAVETLRSL